MNELFTYNCKNKRVWAESKVAKKKFKKFGIWINKSKIWGAAGPPKIQQLENFVYYTKESFFSLNSLKSFIATFTTICSKYFFNLKQK